MKLLDEVQNIKYWQYEQQLDYYEAQALVASSASLSFPTISQLELLREVSEPEFLDSLLWLVTGFEYEYDKDYIFSYSPPTGFMLKRLKSEKYNIILVEHSMPDIVYPDDDDFYETLQLHLSNAI